MASDITYNEHGESAWLGCHGNMLPIVPIADPKAREAVMNAVLKAYCLGIERGTAEAIRQIKRARADDIYT